MKLHHSPLMQVAAAAAIGVSIYFTLLHFGNGALHAMYASPAEAMTQLHIAIAIAFLGGIGFSACAKRFIAWLAA